MKEALKLGLEALCVAVEPKKGKVYAREFEPIDCFAMHEQAITAIKEALAQPAQEPVGWLDSNDKLAEFMHKDLKAEHDKRDSSTPRYFQIPVYTTPPQRTWTKLTDEDDIDWEDGGNLKDLVKAIEAKLKEKNT
jgi:hypothetical protein